MTPHERRRAVALVTLPAYERCLAALAACRTADEVREIRDRATAMRAYARQAKDRTLEAGAFEIRLRAERRLGELLLAQKATVGFAKGGQPYQPATRSNAEQVARRPPTLADAGIRKLSMRAQRLAMLSAGEFRRVIAEGHERIMAVGCEHAALDTLTGSVEWYTKPQWIARARSVMGSIDLDPASCAFAQRVVQAAQWYDKKGDGLAQPWRGNVWLNPPYARGAIDKFVTKLIAERPNYRQAIALVISETETEWFQSLGAMASAVAFPKRRLVFYNEVTEQQQPVWGSAFFYIGERGDAFASVFADCSLVFVPGRAATRAIAPRRAA
jgi:hypothetical protein